MAFECIQVWFVLGYGDNAFKYGILDNSKMSIWL